MTTVDPPPPNPFEDLKARNAAWTASGNRRHLFADAYTAMTQAMVTGLDNDTFLDRAWVGRLVDVFLGYYLRAVDGADSGGVCPSVWADAFSACDRPEEHPLGLVMLGINAHINHDLVFALRDVLEDWPELDDELRLRRFTDYTTVNQVIAVNIDRVQDLVLDPVLPGFEVADRLLGRTDEWAFGQMVTRWRQEVWEDTVRLLGAHSDEEQQRISEEVLHRAQLAARMISLL